jgi:hypothetical protein
MFGGCFKPSLLRLSVGKFACAGERKNLRQESGIDVAF